MLLRVEDAYSVAVGKDIARHIEVVGMSEAADESAADVMDAVAV